MAAVEKIIGKIAERRIREAMQGLATPLSKDAYELGRLAGIQQGLAIAENIVNEAIGEDEQSQPSKKSASRK